MPAEQEFTLILDGIPELTRGDVDALHETGCNEATISRQAGRIAMDFDRTAPTLKDAILGAIRDVRSAGVGARVVQVEGADPDSSREIDE